MHRRPRLVATTFVLAVLVGRAAHSQHSAMPAGLTHEEHLRELAQDTDLKKRGTAAMGFDQDAATHHFTLTAAGGRIVVAANDPTDQKSVAQIRAHLAGIAAAFGNGDFGAPFATHGEVPPGVSQLRELTGVVRYEYERAPAGGRVVLTSANPKAIAAIHEFLRYQIREHRTGDVPIVGQ